MKARRQLTFLCLCGSYTGTVDLDRSLGHNYTLAVTVTVDFCNAIQKTVHDVCLSAGSAGSFIADLDQKCQVFLDPSAVPGKNVPVEVILKLLIPFSVNP